MAGGGDRDIAEAGVEQVRVDPRVSVNENAFGSEPLRAVTGDGIAVVEMTMVDGVELDLTAVVEACTKPTIGWMASMVARSRLATPSNLSGGRGRLRRTHVRSLDRR